MVRSASFAACSEGSFVYKIGGGSGPVEVDETYVGGRLSNMHKEKRERYSIKSGNKGEDYRPRNAGS